MISNEREDGTGSVKAIPMRKVFAGPLELGLTELQDIEPRAKIMMVRSCLYPLRRPRIGLRDRKTLLEY